MKELGSKYGAAGTLKQSPNLHEILAAQSGWSGPRQTPSFASAQAAESRPSQVEVPRTGAKILEAENLSEAGDSKAAGGFPLSCLPFHEPIFF